MFDTEDTKRTLGAIVAVCFLMGEALQRTKETGEPVSDETRDKIIETAEGIAADAVNLCIRAGLGKDEMLEVIAGLVGDSVSAG